jgi:pimeloyl-ACP methyl ester carboxylesterase
MGESAIEDKEVSWKVLDIQINGTITGPKDARSGVVFVAGSGPTDRNWCSPLLPGTNGSGKVLAEKLARAGFLTLRYDKMASGPHVRENLPKFSGKASMQTHLEELGGAVESLLAEKDLDNLFALTNSEGAIHAVNYQLQAKKYRFDGLVLIGAPGRSIGDVARSQLYAQAQALPDPEKFTKAYDDAIAEFLAGRPITMDPAPPEALKPILRSLESPANLPFSRELWAYNLPEYIAKILEPLLVVIGKKDIQIDWKVDGGPLERATAQNTAASFTYPENANHVLKHEDLPREKLTAEYVGAHYNAPDAVLDKEAVDRILNWLKRQTN